MGVTNIINIRKENPDYVSTGKFRPVLQNERINMKELFNSRICRNLDALME